MWTGKAVKPEYLHGLLTVFDVFEGFDVNPYAVIWTLMWNEILPLEKCTTWIGHPNYSMWTAKVALRSFTLVIIDILSVILEIVPACALRVRAKTRAEKIQDEIC